MENQPFDILVINETRLDNSIPDSLIHLPGYSLSRFDRNRNGGGVCAYIRSSINFRRRTSLESDNLELLALEINKPNSKPFLVYCWYRPPHSPVECFDLFEQLVNKAESYYTDIYITGDLNCYLLSDSGEHHTMRLVSLMENYQLSQVINKPTRITGTSSTLIDLFITNNPDSIVNSGVCTLSISDHNLVYAVRKIGIPRKNPKYVETRNFKHFKANSFKIDLINAQWPVINRISCVNEAWGKWKSVFLNILNNHAPKRIIRVRNKPAPRLNSKVRQLMLNRDYLKKKAVKTGLQNDWLSFKKVKNRVNYAIRREKASFYRNKLNANHGNPKSTWKTLNDLMGKKSAITEISEIQGSSSETLTNAKDIADHLNKHFTQIGPDLANKIPATSVNAEDYLRRELSVFEFSEIDPSRVLNLLLKVDIASATGLDQISNKVLRLAAPIIYRQLTDLFNLSVRSGVFPVDWKLAKVSPIYKTGERIDPNNYRPISVLSTIARIFEKVIYKQFYDYLSRKNILDPRQSGFRSLHSTVTALLDLTNQWCFNIDRGLINGVLFLDLKKAFDTVDHNLLLIKLEYVGVRGQTLEWFKSYLSNRSQVVFINGVLSEHEQIKCGVPQGSILGPLLFLIYINDLSSIIDIATTRMYADDTNLTFTACNIPELQEQMSVDIQCLKNWLIANKLTLNVIKTEYMLVGSRQRIATMTYEHVSKRNFFEQS